MMYKTSLVFLVVWCAPWTCVPGAAQHDANEHMHRNPVDRLIDIFESDDRADWQEPDTVIAALGPLAGKTVMDLGAGSGYFTVRLAEHAGRVIAADVDERFIQHLNDRLKKEEYASLSDHVEVRKVPYDDPGLQPGEADAVLVVNVYHHIESRRDYLKKLLRGLSPGGQLLIVDYKMGIAHGPPDHHKLALEVVLDEVHAAGFSRIDTDTTTLQRQYMVSCIK